LGRIPNDTLIWLAMTVFFVFVALGIGLGVGAFASGNRVPDIATMIGVWFGATATFLAVFVALRRDGREEHKRDTRIGATRALLRYLVKREQSYLGNSANAAEEGDGAFSAFVDSEWEEILALRPPEVQFVQAANLWVKRAGSSSGARSNAVQYLGVALKALEGSFGEDIIERPVQALANERARQRERTTD
jgi:hypothetical protein